MRRTTLLLATLLAAGVPDAVQAIDHANLDEGRPLRLEDPYPVAAGEWALEAGVGVVVPRRGPDRGTLAVEVLYGAWPNLQLGVGSLLSTDPHAIHEPPRSGDLELHALYNVNQETLTLPALGAKLALTLPTGVDASGAVVELKGIVTKSFDRLGVHLNVAYEFLTDPEPGSSAVTIGPRGADREERGLRDGRYAIALGVSYPVGAPRHTRTTLLADVFTEQGSRHGESNVAGVEVGVRHQLTPRIVLDAGVGTELAGPADRARFYATAGVSVGF